MAWGFIFWIPVISKCSWNYVCLYACILTWNCQSQKSCIRGLNLALILKWMKKSIDILKQLSGLGESRPNKHISNLWYNKAEQHKCHKVINNAEWTQRKKHVIRWTDMCEGHLPAQASNYKTHAGLHQKIK